MSDKHLDNLLHAIGDWKRFTILQYVCVLTTLLPITFQLFSNVFTVRSVPHRCAKPLNESDLLDSHGINLHNLTIAYQQCQIEVVSTVQQKVVKTEPCLYGMQYDLPKDASVISQFDLVCDRAPLAKLSQTLVIAGQTVGAIVVIAVSDRFGRKPLFFIGNLGFFGVGLANAFSPNYLTFAILKFFIGVFQQALVVNLTTLLLELLTTERRMAQAWLAGLAWDFCLMTLAPLAYLHRNLSWRILQISLSLSSIVVVHQYWSLEESLRWLVTNGKREATVSQLKLATKVNKTSFPSALQVYEDMCRKPDALRGQNGKARNVTSKRLTLLDLLKVKVFLCNSMVMWFAWATVALSYFFLYLTASSLAGNQYLNFFLMAVMEIPANAYQYLTLNRLGRKPSLIMSLAFISVGLTASGIFRSLEATSINSTLATAFAMVAVIGASASFSTLFFYTPELFPTNIRTQATGLCSIISRVGGMTAPFTGFLSQKAKWAPGVLIGVCACLVSVLLVFLPETNGRDLPQTIADRLAWHHKERRRPDEATDEVTKI